MTTLSRTVSPSLSRYETAAMEDRCAIRARVNMPAILRPSCGSRFDVRIYDLAIAGFSSDAVTSLPIGGRCWVTLPGLASLESELIWNDGHKIGCAFAQLLNVAVYDRLVSRYRQTSD